MNPRIGLGKHRETSLVLIKHLTGIVCADISQSFVQDQGRIYLQQCFKLGNRGNIELWATYSGQLSKKFSMLHATDYI